MPRLPQFDASINPISSVGQGVNPGRFGGGGRLLQSAGESIFKIGDQWQKAQTLNQYSQEKNNVRNRIDDIILNAEEDQDHGNLDAYIGLIDKESSIDAKIGDPVTKKAFEYERAFDFDRAKTKLRGIFRNKTISRQQDLITENNSIAENDYVSASSDIERAQVKENHLQFLAANLDAGFIDQEQYESELEDVKEWNFQRAMASISADPEATMQNIDSFGLDEREKNEIVNIASASLARAQKISKIANFRTIVENESKILDLVFNDRESSISEKILEINKQKLNRNISREISEDSLRYLKQLAKVNRTTNSADMARVVRMIYDVGSTLNQDAKDAEMVYLKGIQSIQSEILNLDNLSEEDRGKLINTLTNVTSQTTADATELLKYNKTYGQVSDYFDQVLPSHLGNEALRQVFYLTFGKDLSEEEFKSEIRSISDSLVRADRFQTFNLLDEARNELGVDSDLRIRSDSLGNRGIVLYENGIPVKEVRSLSETLRGEFSKFFKSKANPLISRKEFLKGKQNLENKKEFFRKKTNE